MLSSKPSPIFCSDGVIWMVNGWTPTTAPLSTSPIWALVRRCAPRPGWRCGNRGPSTRLKGVLHGWRAKIRQRLFDLMMENQHDLGELLSRKKRKPSNARSWFALPMRLMRSACQRHRVGYDQLLQSARHQRLLACGKGPESKHDRHQHRANLERSGNVRWRK